MRANKSAMKQDRQNKKHRMQNRIRKSKVHTAFLALIKAFESKNKEETQKKLTNYQSEIDKAVNKGLIHRNNAARKKSRISHKINHLNKEVISA